jgi:CheY-like chemotaxis protein
MHGKKIILLIDDDLDDHELFNEAISEINPGYIRKMAMNGEEALNLLRTEDNLPDLIFLDLNMPRLNGKNCLAEIKKDDRLKNIPVIIFSTSSSPKDIEETRQLGAVGFFTKPSNFLELRENLQGHIEGVLGKQN